MANVLANWGAFMGLAAVSFFLSPYIVHHLGNSQYGVWAIVGSVVGYLGLLDLGVRGAVMRYIARYLAEGDGEAANRLTSSALALFAGSGILAVVLSATVAAMLPVLFQVPPENLTAARLAVIIGGATVGLSLVSGVYGGTLAGLQRFTAISTIDLGLELARGAAVWIVLARGGGIPALAAIQFVLSLVRLLIYRQFSRRLLPALHISWRGVTRDTLRIIISFSSCSILVQLSGMVILSTDSLVIGALLPISAVTFFAVGANLIEYSRRLLSGISQTLTPMVSATDAGADPHHVGRLLTRSVRLGTLVVLPILVTFLVRGGTFIALWMGPAYRTSSGDILRTLAVALCFSASYQMITATMFGLNRHRKIVPIFLAEAGLNLLLSLLLARPFGIIGVAIGTTIPRLIVATCVGPWIAKSVLGIPRRVFAREAWLRPMAAIVPFAIFSVVIDRTWVPFSLTVYLAQVALSLPVAFAGAWLMALNEDERMAVRAWLDRSRSELTAGVAA